MTQQQQPQNRSTGPTSQQAGGMQPQSGQVTGMQSPSWQMAGGMQPQSGRATQQPGQMGQGAAATGGPGVAGQTGTMPREMGMRLSDVETPQQRAAVEDVARAIQVCGWCADQCIQEADPNMTECIRLCEDVVELGETVLALTSRNSRYADSVLGTFQQVLQACAQECGQHPHGHCQECAEELNWTVESIQQLYGTYGRQAGMGVAGQ